MMRFPLTALAAIPMKRLECKVAASVSYRQRDSVFNVHRLSYRPKAKASH